MPNLFKKILGKGGVIDKATKEADKACGRPVAQLKGKDPHTPLEAAVGTVAKVAITAVLPTPTP